MQNQRQGCAWIVFLVWIVLPILLFYLLLIFTG